MHVDVPTRTERRERRGLRFTPAGWLALAVALLCLVGGCTVVSTEILTATADLDDLATLPPVATNTPRPTTTPTAGPSPTPEGWTVVVDGDGSTFLAPPPEDEAAIREAFEAVLGRSRFRGTPEEMAAEYDREAAQAQYEQLFVSASNDLTLVVIAVPDENWGPENPVKCQDFSTCVVAQAKMGPATGMLLFVQEDCQRVGLDAPCLLSGSSFGGDNDPYQLFIATVAYQEDEVWRVVDFQWQTLPEPPLSP